MISLEIMRAKGKTSVELKDGKISVNIKIKTDSNISEQPEGFDPTNPEVIEKLRAEAIKKIRQEILAAYAKAKDLKCDIFAIGEMVHKKYPNNGKRWRIVGIISFLKSVLTSILRLKFAEPAK
jgi:hypothetical protein